MTRKVLDRIVEATAYIVSLPIHVWFVIWDWTFGTEEE